MPFGAQLLDDGAVRFRLWAPAAQQVEVTFEDKKVPLSPCGGGWFETITDEAHSGTQYFFRINGGQQVPDPASRFQPRDVHAPSEVIDSGSFEWHDENWRGRRWEEAVIYELHVGTFTEAGTFSGVQERLDYFADLGITAIELMPVADFPGKRNWGYDGVLPFAPDSSYGRPEDLRSLVQSAHDRGIMVLLDVVYNHFGPEGNYLRAYAPQFFTGRHHTPWGEAINFDGQESRAVRDFFIHNALYWLTEYHFDGLRFDAVHAIVDDSTPDFLTELAQTVRSSIEPDRHVHLILENDNNQSRYLQRTAHCQPRTYTAQWNDDIHHVLHVLMTGEIDGYYADYSGRPIQQLARCLTEGFAYQGERSQYRNGEVRGEPSSELPPTAFVSFLQNHDQIGNRAFGERISKLAGPRAVRAAVAILLLAPCPPLLFMGEEFGAETPFLFFCDFEKELARLVTEGRRNEFARFARFNDPAARERIPDPSSIKTFETSRLDWNEISHADHQAWFRFYRDLLKIRCRHIVPRLSSSCSTKVEAHTGASLHLSWQFSDKSQLTLIANLQPEPAPEVTLPDLPILYATEGIDQDILKKGILPAWSVVWFLES